MTHEDVTRVVTEKELVGGDTMSQTWSELKSEPSITSGQPCQSHQITLKVSKTTVRHTVSCGELK